jgi:hypothetical protein
MVNPISFPQYQVNSAVDPSMWSSLGNLGNVYAKAQADAVKQRTLAQLGPDAVANANLLVGSGQGDLAEMGLRLQGALRGETREDERFKITDARANEQLNIAKGQERRAQETYDEETPTGRAKKVKEAGIDPTLPQAKEYILTGKMPPPRDPTFNEAVEQRKQVAIANGLKPDSPGYQSYVLTGKMPREDAQPLSATDKKLLADADDHINSGLSVIASLNRAKALSPKAFTGPMADRRGYAASFLGETSDTGKAGIATTQLNNEVLANALAQLKSIFGAAPTEGERKILLELQGSVNQPDVVRQGIYDRAIIFAQQKLEAAKKRADEMRGGTFYKPGGGASGTGAPAPAAAVPDPLGIR